MGLFMDPRRKPEDTRASYARRRAPWLVLIAIACSAYIFYKGVNNTGWIAILVIWVATFMSIASADWSDLRRDKERRIDRRPW